MIRWFGNSIRSALSQLNTQLPPKHQIARPSKYLPDLAHNLSTFANFLLYLEAQTVLKIFPKI